MGKVKEIIRIWHGMKATEGFHKLVLFLCFVIVSALFWVILSLNDNVTQSFSIRVKIDNVPDSITFINIPPNTISVTVKDRGTNLVRTGVFTNLHVNFNFRDFADNGIFKVKRAEVTNALKNAFGNNALITSSSVDSLCLHYTTGKGRRVPVVVDYDVVPAPGSILSQYPEPSQKSVLVYSYSPDVDTITRVYTERIVKRNVKESLEVEVKLRAIPESRIIPPSVNVKIPVETMVKKESVVPILVKGTPNGESLLLFPDRVKVSYYTPMSLFNSDLVPLEIWVDYADVREGRSVMLPLKVSKLADYVENARVTVDSVEYTLVR